MSADVILPQTGYPTMRRWPRYKVDVPVRVITQGASKVAIVTGRGSELNLGGMTVFAGTELAMGAEVAVEFTPPYSSNPIRVRCLVRNRKGYRYGVEFITETEQDSCSVQQIEAVLSGLGSPVEESSAKARR
ncbi:MAG TPA: PilZ domain-containing protein [Terriglobales bacterium]|nr:PilZ domain-containing protein [Terriglobales bacterium]